MRSTFLIPHSRFLGAAIALLLLLASGCQGDQGPSPSIALAISPDSLSVAQGGSGSIVASITRGGGFTGSLTIGIEGLPVGVTAAASNMATTALVTSATVTVSVEESVAPGSYSATVRVSSPGVAEATISIGLTVTARPAISLTVQPAAVRVGAGGSTKVDVVITRTNFTGEVTLALEGASTGISGSVNGASNGSIATITLQVAASVAPGLQVLTIRGSGIGISAATTALAMTTTPAPSFDILPVAIDPTPVTQGMTGAAAVSLVRTGGFAGPLDLTVDSLPSGVTATFDPASVSGTTSTLTLAVGIGVSVGDYQLSIRATASGHAPKTRAFMLSVVASASFGLSLTPPGPVAVRQGSSPVNLTVAITRVNFTGPVALAVTANTGGTGLTAALLPATSAGNSATLTVSATSQIVPAIYAVSVTGTAPGLPDQTVTLNVDVTGANGGATVTLDYSGCYPNDVPVWLAYQDGRQPWQVVKPSGNVFRFVVRSARGGIAWVWRPSGATVNWVNVEYYSGAEMTSLRPEQLCLVFPAPKNVTVATTNLPDGHSANVSLAGSTGSASSFIPTAQLSVSKNGIFDLVGYAVDQAGVSDRMFLRRDVNTTPIPSGGSVGFPVDFADPSYSFMPAAATFSLAGPLGGMGRITVNGAFRSGGCAWAPLQAVWLPTAGDFTFYGVPSSRQRPADSHGVRVEVANTSFETYRSVFLLFGPVTNRTITLPSELPVFAPTTVAGSYAALRFRFAVPSGLAPSVNLSYREPQTGKNVSLYASESWLGGASVDLVMPFFSGLTGWDDQWMLPSGATIDWAAAVGGNRTFMGSSDRDLGSCGVGRILSGRQGRL